MKQPIFVCSQCWSTIGKRDADTITAYCQTCDRMSSIVKKVGRR